MGKLKIKLNKILSTFIIILFIGLVTIVFWQVFARYVLKNSSAFSEELAKILFVWVSLLTAALLFGEKGHMNIAVVVDKFPLKIGLAVQLLAGLVNMLFIVYILVYGGYLAVKLGWSQTNSSIPFLTTGFIYAALPISGLFSSFYEICNIYEDVKRILTNE